MIFKKYCSFFSLFEDRFTFTKSVDPGEIQHNAAFYLDFHCLQKHSSFGLNIVYLYTMYI